YMLARGDGTVVDRAAGGEPLGEEFGFTWTPAPGALVGERTVEFSIRPPMDVVLQLRRQLTPNVTPDGFMDLRMRGTDPYRITFTLNAIIDQFSQTAGEIKSRKMREDVRILEEQLVKLQQDLSQAEAALEQFKVATATEPKERGVIVPGGLAMTDQTAFQSYFVRQGELDQLERDRDAI